METAVKMSSDPQRSSAIVKDPIAEDRWNRNEFYSSDRERSIKIVNDPEKLMETRQRS